MLKPSCFYFALLLLVLGGCASAPQVEGTPHNPFEQLLLTTATNEALTTIEVSELRNETVFVDSQYLETYMKPYVLGSIRDLLSRNGALLSNRRTDASVIIEPRSGALGIDEAESLIGLPAIPIVIPAAGTFETPELPLYASDKSESITSLALLAYRRDGSHLFSRQGTGRSYVHRYTFIFFLNLRFTDLPERESFGEP